MPQAKYVYADTGEPVPPEDMPDTEQGSQDSSGIMDKVVGGLDAFGRYAATNTKTAVKALLPHSEDPIGATKEILKNPSTVVGAPIENYVSQVSSGFGEAADRLKDQDFLGALAKAGYSIIPFIGPGLERGGEDLAQGKIPEATGEVGAAFMQAAGPELAKDVKPFAGLKKGANSAARSVYKPPKTKLPGKAQQDVNTLTKAKALPNEEGAAAYRAQKNAAGQAIDEVTDALPQTESVSGMPAINALRNRASTALKSDRQIFIDAEKEFINNLVVDEGQQIRRMTPSEAQKLKVQYHQRATRAKSTAYAGGQNPLRVETDQIVAKALGNTLRKQFPELEPYYASYAKKNSAEPTLLAAVSRIENMPKGITVADLYAAGGGGVVGAMVGGNVTAGVTGAFTAVMAHLLRDPTFRIKTALRMAKAADVPFPVAEARLVAYVDALTAGSKPTPEEVTEQKNTEAINAKQ